MFFNINNNKVVFIFKNKVMNVLKDFIKLVSEVIIKFETFIIRTLIK